MNRADRSRDSGYRLFDPGPRSDDRPALHAEAEFSFLNRSAWEETSRVRSELDDWFTRYPSGHARELRSRFRSRNDIHHRGAFLELFLHEVLTRLDAKLVIHPRVPGTAKRPDFLAEIAGAQVYLEAAVVTGESAAEVAARARVQRVYDAVNDLESPDFWIGVESEGEPRTPPPIRRIKSFLRANLDRADYASIREIWASDDAIRRLPRWRFEHEGWMLEFFPIPKGKARGSRVGARWACIFTACTPLIRLAPCVKQLLERRAGMGDWVGRS